MGLTLLGHRMGQRLLVSWRDYGDDIYVMNADGTDVVNITKDGVGSYEPAWSPDGTKIAFSRRSSDRRSVHIYVVNADGTDLVKITNNLGYNASPTWGLTR